MAISYCEVLKNDMDNDCMLSYHWTTMKDSGIQYSMSLVQHTCCNLYSDMVQGTHHILHVHTSSMLQ